MKTHKRTNLALMFPLLAALAVPALQANAVTNTWTGASTVTNLWSDTNNWSLLQLPLPANDVVFTNTGSTNVQGAVDNVVDSNRTINSLSYETLDNSFNYNTTQINPGQTLTVDSPGNTNINLLLASTLTTDASDQLYATILGASRLVVGNPSSPSTAANVWLNVRQTSASSGSHMATLDLSGLDSFTYAGGQVRIGGDGAAGALNLPVGTLILAKTNLMIATFSQGIANVLNAGIIVGFGANNGGIGVVQLGQQNTINANNIEIGATRAVSPGGQMFFQNGLSNPTLKLRGADGVSRVTWLNIGDNIGGGTSSAICAGILDLTGGTVDAQVDGMYVGRNSGSGTASVPAGGNGTLTLTAGTFDVTSLSVGTQYANNRGPSTGTVNVRGTASLIVGSLYIGFGRMNGIGTGTLNIDGGQVAVSAGLAEKSAIGSIGLNNLGNSTINLSNNGLLNLQPSGAVVPGNITVDTLNFSGGSVTNYGTLSLNNLNVIAPATVFTVYPGQGLGAVGTGVAGTLTTSGDLTLTNANLIYDLVDPFSVNDQIAVTGTLTLSGTNLVQINPTTTTPNFALGAYTLMTYGTLSGNAANLQVTGALTNSRLTFAFDTTSPNVVLNVGGSLPASLTWSGDGSANRWDLNTSTNWNSNTEKFNSFDTVAFDDSSTNPVVNLVGTLLPGSVTVNTASSYTFSGSGKMSGAAALVNNGGGTLTILNTNDYTGATTINGGTLLVNGALGNTAVSVKFGATLGGTGAILGSVTVASGGTLSPGTSIGTLTISNNLVLSAGSTAAFEANLGTPANDKVVGLNKVTYGGTLNLTQLGRAPVVSDTFKLFSATTYAGTFASISPAAPGAGLAWNTNTLAIDGTLRIASLAPPNIGVQVAGNQLSLSWPSANAGWHLQAQTNSIGVGLSTNWVDVPASGTTNLVIMTINPANGSVFYRLISP